MSAVHATCGRVGSDSTKPDMQALAALARAKKKGGCSNLKDWLRGVPNPTWLEWFMGWRPHWTRPA